LLLLAEINLLKWGFGVLGFWGFGVLGDPIVELELLGFIEIL
jgi:hypothetical protein